MFAFSDGRLLLAFATAIAVLTVAWWILARVSVCHWTARPIHAGTVPGAVLFGAGWALSGACPSTAFVQIGEGQLGGVLTVAAIFAGNWLYAVVHERLFQWSVGSCADS